MDTRDDGDAADASDAADAADARDDGDARDGGDAEVPFRCTSSAQCTDGGVDGGPAVCEPDAGVCVECLENSDCSGKATAPICEARTCRACKLDSECPDPAICLTDGHCAPATEVIFVESLSSGCSTADGSSANPYCTPNAAVLALAASRNVIVLRGAMGDRMLLGTTGVSPVVIGRKNASNIEPSVPATNMTAITVISDTVLIRDLLVNAGTTPTSKGIAATGASTNLTLSNVKVNLGMGLGIQADGGATLTMRRCTLENNLGTAGMGGGGIFLNGAYFDIENTSVLSNGPGMDTMGNVWGGIRINNPPTTGARLSLVSVKDNKQVGVSCSGPVAGAGVLASGNTGGIEITTVACGFSPCGVMTSTCGSQQ